jgi:CDGSH-type Zn-finger protein
MAEFSTVEKNGHIRHIVKAQPGETIYLCRCYGSKKFPFCDGTHNTVNHNDGPAVVEIAETKDSDPA